MDPVSYASPAAPAEADRDIDMSPFLRQEGRRPARAPAAKRGAAAPARLTRGTRPGFIAAPGRGAGGTGRALLLTWLMERLWHAE